jgi:hypothetical protein
MRSTNSRGLLVYILSYDSSIIAPTARILKLSTALRMCNVCHGDDDLFRVYLHMEQLITIDSSLDMYVYVNVPCQGQHPLFIRRTVGRRLDTSQVQCDLMGQERARGMTVIWKRTGPGWKEWFVKLKSRDITSHRNKAWSPIKDDNNGIV